jgi:acylphosphatase
MSHGDTASRWLISGRVQGVGFRWFVYRYAEELGVQGWARNLPDGRVEVVATGEPRVVEQFEQVLHRGPLLARVEHVEKEDYPHELAASKPFDIR